MEESDLRERDAQRTEYINQFLMPLLERDRDAFLHLVKRMLFQVAEDIFGAEGEAIGLLKKTYANKEYDEAIDFSSLLEFQSQPKLVERSQAAQVLQSLTDDVYAVAKPDYQYLDSEFIYGVWITLEEAGIVSRRYWDVLRAIYSFT